MSKKKGLVLTAAGSALLSPLATMTAANAAGTHPATPTTPSGSSATACAANSAASQGTHLDASAVTAVAGGGSKYVYQLPGHTLTFNVPPASFNARTASAGDLARYGLPARPVGGQALTQWNALMSHLGGRAVAPKSISIAPAMRDNIPNPTRATARAVKAGTAATVSDATTNIWAGYVSKEWGQSTYYGNVEGTWTEPSIKATTCANAQHVTWVGVGGYGSSSLLQDGTTQTNSAWYEYLGPNGTGVSITPFTPSLNIASGDKVYAYTGYASGTATWIVENDTTGTYESATLSKASSFYDGSSVEFIDERPSACTRTSCTPYPLADYGSTAWLSASAATSSAFKTQVPLTSLTNVSNLTMVDASNNTMAIATNEGFNGNAFSTDWKSCS